MSYAEAFCALLIGLPGLVFVIVDWTVYQNKKEN